MASRLSRLAPNGVWHSFPPFMPSESLNRGENIANSGARFAEISENSNNMK